MPPRSPAAGRMYRDGKDKKKKNREQPLAKSRALTGGTDAASTSESVGEPHAPLPECQRRSSRFDPPALSRVCFWCVGGESASTCALVFSLNQKRLNIPTIN